MLNENAFKIYHLKFKIIINGFIIHFKRSL